MQLGLQRLAAQHLIAKQETSPQHLVARMGALQAQDFNMAKWAIGVRLRNVTEDAIHGALDSGSILRTHVLRPTWHLVSSDDIHWMLELTAPQILTSLRARHRQLALSPREIMKCNRILEKALRDGTHLSRSELVKRLGNAGIRTSEDNRAAHILLCAELEGIICSGRVTGREPTYALLDERVPVKKIMSRDEAIANLAERYFRSHGPATIDDFAWWSGLPKKEIRKRLDAVPGLQSESIQQKIYWFATAETQIRSRNAVFLLPAYDEFLISYQDRSAILPEEKFRQVVSTNGIFRPIVVIKGKIAGLWKRTVQKDRVNIEIQAFSALSPQTRRAIDDAARSYGKFIGKPVQTTYVR